MSTLEFFFDYGSPYSHLANGVIEGFAKSAGAELVYRPMLLGGVFKATGNQSPIFETIEAKRNYGGGSLRRTSALHGVPIVMNPHFPINSMGLMRLAVAAKHEGVFEAYHAAAFAGLWQEGLNLGDVEVQAEMIRAAGLDAEKLFARSGDDDVKAELRATTDEAVARGAFGAPTFFVGDEMFFGVDHLPYLSQCLSEQTSSLGSPGIRPATRP
ncbi:MAG: 2-hydroxychromene-2-carboxylate isomerase [Myxococcales bacterium]